MGRVTTILDSIDGAVRDWETSRDAMRWVPGEARGGLPPARDGAVHVQVHVDVAPLAEALGLMLADLTRLLGSFTSAAGSAAGEIVHLAAVLGVRPERRRGGGRLAVDGHAYQRRLRARRKRKRHG